MERGKRRKRENIFAYVCLCVYTDSCVNPTSNNRGRRFLKQNLREDKIVRNHFVCACVYVYVFVWERGARVRVHVYVCLWLEMYVYNNNSMGRFSCPPTTHQPAASAVSSSQPIKEEEEERERDLRRRERNNQNKTQKKATEKTCMIWFYLFACFFSFFWFGLFFGVCVCVSLLLWLPLSYHHQQLSWLKQYNNFHFS